MSARSNRGNVDIDAIMGILNGGGGNDYSASCNTLYVDAETLSEEKEQILKDIQRIIKKEAVPNIKEYVVLIKRIIII